MRSKQQQIDAVLSTRDFLERLSRIGVIKGVRREIRVEARALLRQFPAYEDLYDALQTGLQEPVLEEAPPPSMTEWVRRRYRYRQPVAEEPVPVEID